MRLLAFWRIYNQRVLVSLWQQLLTNGLVSIVAIAQPKVLVNIEASSDPVAVMEHFLDVVLQAMS